MLKGQQRGVQLPAWLLAVGVPAVGEAAGDPGVVQHPQHRVMGQRLPVGLALTGAFEVPPGEQQPGGAERLHAGGRRPGGLEGGEQVRHGSADGDVGVEDDVPGGVVDQADRQRHDELAAAGLGQLPAAQPGLDEMELSLAEPAFHGEQEPSLVPRVVEAVFVADQRAGHPAELEELVPVGGVPGQA